MPPDLTFPWAGESGRPRPRYTCTLAQLVHAHRDLEERWAERLQALEERQSAALLAITNEIP